MVAHDLCGQTRRLQLCFQCSGILRGHGKQQAAGGLGIKQNFLHREGYFLKPDKGPGVVAVALTGSGVQAGICGLPRTGQYRHRMGIDDAGEFLRPSSRADGPES